MSSGKFLTVVAFVSGVIWMMAPPPPHPHPFPADSTYLRALADVHEFCEADFAALCAVGEQPEAPSALRRLTTVLMDMEVVDETAGEHGPGPEAEPLRLGGPREDNCLRENFDALSQPCAASVALLDGAAADLPARPRGPCPLVFLGLAAVVFLVLVGRKMRAKKRAVRAVLDAIRADPKLAAAVEATGVAVPAPCACNGRACCRTFLGAALFAGVLSLVFGPATTLASALFAAAASKCLACCRRAPPADDAPPAYAAVVADEAPADAADAKIAADAKASLDAAKAADAEVVKDDLEKPLL